MTQKSDREKILAIVLVLRRHEYHLSDGYKYYLPLDTDERRMTLLDIAREILDAIDEWKTGGDV